MIEADGSTTVVLVTNAREFAGGAAIAALSEAGARIYCHDRSFSTEISRAAFASDHGRGDLVVLAESEPRDVVEAVLRIEGKLDALVSNDVHPATRSPIDEIRPADFRNMLEDLMVFPARVAAAAAAPMKKRKAGRIVFVTSAVADRGLPNYSLYAAARGGTNALAVSLAVELGPHGISVNAIAPNFVENPTYFPPEVLNQPKVQENIRRNVPLRRVGRTEETGALVAFLAGPACGFMTGQVVSLSGGWN